MKNILSSIIVVGICFLTSSALALTIDFSFQTPTDNSGKTSPIGVDSNNNPLPGYFIETFDQPGSIDRTIITDTGGQITIDAGGGFNTLDPTSLNVTNGLGITSGSTSGESAAPAGDETFYAFGPGPNAGATTSSVRIENTDFNAYQPGLFINYLGLYYGSIDNYNTIAFYNGEDLLTTDSGFLMDGILEGSEILGETGGTSGNQFAPGSNVYVNLSFDNNELFTAFEFRTTGIAFELDNIVAGVTPVPEPSTFLLLGGGLIGLGLIGRRRKQQ